MAELETFISLSEAAAKYRLSAKVLTRLVNDGKIRAVRANGDVLVAEMDVKKEALVPRAKDDFTELEGVEIRLSEAAEKYSVPERTLSRWAHAKRIRIMRQGPKLLILNEADVARAAKLAAELGMRQGKKVITGPVYKTASG